MNSLLVIHGARIFDFAVCYTFVIIVIAPLFPGHFQFVNTNNNLMRAKSFLYRQNLLIAFLSLLMRWLFPLFSKKEDRSNRYFFRKMPRPRPPSYRLKKHWYLKWCHCYLHISERTSRTAFIICFVYFWIFDIFFGPSRPIKEYKFSSHRTIAKCLLWIAPASSPLTIFSLSVSIQRITNLISCLTL